MVVERGCACGCESHSGKQKNHKINISCRISIFEGVFTTVQNIQTLPLVYRYCAHVSCAALTYTMQILLYWSSSRRKFQRGGAHRTDYLEVERQGFLNEVPAFATTRVRGVSGRNICYLRFEAFYICLFFAPYAPRTCPPRQFFYQPTSAASNMSPPVVKVEMPLHKSSTRQSHSKIRVGKPCSGCLQHATGKNI